MVAFVVEHGSALSSKIRRSICDEAKGTSEEYIASAVFQNYPDSKRWVDQISKITRKLTDKQYDNLNEYLGLSHEDAIFVSMRPDTFTVIPGITTSLI